ncbi:dihydrolipoyl dehydrogenase family protein [Streptomyces albireticuli]|uniref:Pyridine nucleotide-disulfide oxidoreductase n=1 Tax=Streptomyces albireticuli TaxID=1940 RepID=A0A2A2CWG1_9ACTN|nr:NAD(P)/FAD-dependent oxidoreductase [Streptomyces albireticuli]MCD9145815.1 NAD(P)/FAD-dependent oxidoreductase [Streptomyces albireticuli]MCD9165892.1 NAD(P)/FAD-dependent oxidoreductase [Streptomyces albireticuli]MCD9194429.1 NAD(P)/FAD-dependent oxidoreductase [Streptomyces albireticuli]PAU44533.1 pyridine nucleotide-disulfide oxidoreductase [Streptomyces albireticuli]
MAEQVDVVVIGMGPGGEHVAGRLAEAGLSVVGVEAELVGGECPYWGCVPSKMMIRAGNLLAEARRVPGMAGAARVEPDWAPVARRIRDEATDDWNDQVAADRFTGKGGRLARGRGRLAGPGRVVVDGPGGGEFQARLGVVLATGTKPSVPPVPGLAGVPFWTNRDAIAAKEPPRSLTVLGGGAIGLELAQVFARFGTHVEVVEAMDGLLPAEEPEAGELLMKVLRRDGVVVRTAARATGVRHHGDTFTVTLESGNDVTADQLLVATGRRVDLTDLGLETVGLDPAARALPVDSRLLAAPALWGVGDVTGHGAFTHVAMYEAEIVVRAVLGDPGPAADYRALPRVTFTDPEVGAVGLTEKQARDKGLRVRTGLAQLPPSARGWIHKAGNEGLVKLVEDVDRGVLVGATTIGPAGGEVMYGLAVAVQAGVPVEALRHMIYAYPTFHRCVEEALAGLRSGDTAE